MPNAPPLLRAERITKRFGEGEREIRAVDEVSLSLPGGRIYGLIGPNGAGKTTFLRICATLLRPTSGELWIAGCHAEREAREVRGLLGYLSATTGIYQRLTPRELMRYFGTLHGMSEERIAARTAELFETLEISAHGDRVAARLSTGTRQKVSIARAFLHDPPVLILDEPTNGLDVLVRQSLLDLLRRSCTPSRLIILSTHDLPEAEELCDAFIFIAEGRIAAHGSKEDLLEEGRRDLKYAFFAALGAAGRSGREA
ncbi:MAG: ABC transporter ATP-binding protein [Planctomycetes bacterium]|nr:ABC transporter ATP-binding protein [Planctomycetota bacterium]